MNSTLKSAIDVTTVAGAAVLIVNSALQMTKQKEMKGIVFPLVGIFVGVAALNYAMNDLKTTKSMNVEYSNFSAEDQGWNNQVEILNQNPATKATISAAQASSFANACHAAMDGYQTDEDALYNVFNNLKNNADFALLMSAYGSREISSGAWNPEPNFTGTLTGGITSECSAKEKAKLNQILQSKGITNRV